jgi:hypothetical protein
VHTQLAANAIETTRIMRFVACFVRATDFIEAGELRSHETLRDAGKLVYRDTFEDLAMGSDYVVFISHQWLGFDSPDNDEQVQYKSMCAALERIATKLHEEADNPTQATRERILRRMLVWVDYVSIPQIGEGTLQLGIQSLSAYCSLANDFVICAPKATHADTGETCDFETYRRRMWCRAEQLCHVLRNGASCIWLATEESCERIITPASAAKVTEEQWLSETIRVFGGDCTDEVDKIALVAPILGLYAELYACRDVGETVPFLTHVLRELRSAREEVFPRAFTPAAGRRRRRKKQSVVRRLSEAMMFHRTGATPAQASPPPEPEPAPLMGGVVVMRSSRGGGGGGVGKGELEGLQRAPGSPSSSFTRGPASKDSITVGALTPLRVLSNGRYALFGDLIETIEQMIDGDESLRSALSLQVLKRRGGMRRRSSALSKHFTPRNSNENRERARRFSNGFGRIVDAVAALGKSRGGGSGSSTPRSMAAAAAAAASGPGSTGRKQRRCSMPGAIGCHSKRSLDAAAGSSTDSLALGAKPRKPSIGDLMSVEFQRRRRPSLNFLDCSELTDGPADTDTAAHVAAPTAAAPPPAMSPSAGAAPIAAAAPPSPTPYKASLLDA